MIDKYEVRKKQIIGSKMARYSREIDYAFKDRYPRLKMSILDLVSMVYMDGFTDGDRSAKRD